MLAHLKRATGGRSFDSVDASIGHAAVRGTIIGYFAVLALVSALIFTTAGVGFGVALAVGAYVAIWGGPGWGGMVAAQMQADRLEAAERSAARNGDLFLASARVHTRLQSGMTNDRRPGDRRASEG